MKRNRGSNEGQPKNSLVGWVIRVCHRGRRRVVEILRTRDSKSTTRWMCVEQRIRLIDTFFPGFPRRTFRTNISNSLSLSLVLTPPVWKFTNSSEVSSEDEKQRRKQRCNSSLWELFWRERGVGKQSRGGGNSGKDLSKAVKMVFNANF